MNSLTTIIVLTLMVICLFGCSKYVRKSVTYKDLEKIYLDSQADSSRLALRYADSQKTIKNLRDSINSLNGLMVLPESEKIENEIIATKKKESLNLAGKEFENSKDLNNNISLMVSFRENEFFAYEIDDAKSIELFWKDKNNKRIGNFNRLKNSSKEKRLLFGMNAGIFKPGGIPEGLFIQDGEELVPLNLNMGNGNFYMKPNAVFYILKDGRSFIEETETFEQKQAMLNINYATQSGPMLVSKGKIHPKFVETSTNYNIRNGVGVTNNGKVVFIISQKEVNLYTFASIFKDHFKCQNALYLDGTISKAFIPALNKMDLQGNFGPMIGIFEE